MPESGDTPLPVTEIEHRNPHDAGDIESLGVKSSRTARTARSRARIKAERDRVDGIQLAQKEMQETQTVMKTQLDALV